MMALSQRMVGQGTTCAARPATRHQLCSAPGRAAIPVATFAGHDQQVPGQNTFDLNLTRIRQQFAIKANRAIHHIQRTAPVARIAHFIALLLYGLSYVFKFTYILPLDIVGFLIILHRNSTPSGLTLG
jgi:hypothetical protein